MKYSGSIAFQYITENGGYVITGYSGDYGNYDFLLIKTDRQGNVE